MTNEKDKKLTIKEVAKLAGVSTATVSRVVNEPDKVSSKLREKVEQIIKEYNYVPNLLAKNFTTNNSKTIAIFVYDLSNPFFISLIEGINRIAFDYDYNLIICDTRNNLKREMKYLNYLKSIQISGIILTEGASEETILKMDSTIPCVMIDRNLGRGYNFPLVTSDNYSGAKMAVNHLLKLNHKRIGFAGGPCNITTSCLRKKGYLDTIKSNGLEINEDYLFQSNFSVMGGVKAIEYFVSLPEMPTAIFCANDQIAQGIILRSHTLNISIPKDISLIGFDGIMTDTFYPRITTVRQQIEKLQEATMDIIFKLIKKDECEKRVIIPTKLEIGETCIKV